eukprot:INCI556.1.p1 GENE.INCI556.1~~INCI556.1.p1  ORF type:complete len:1038 (+),score=195.25 INCI556.1:169-3282(+)
MADGTAEEQALVGKRWDEFVAQHLAKTTPPALKPSTNLHTVLERARRLHGDGIALLRNKSSQQALEQAYVVLKKFARLYFDQLVKHSNFQTPEFKRDREWYVAALNDAVNNLECIRELVKERIRDELFESRLQDKYDQVFADVEFSDAFGPAFEDAAKSDASLFSQAVGDENLPKPEQFASSDQQAKPVEVEYQWQTPPAPNDVLRSAALTPEPAARAASQSSTSTPLYPSLGPESGSEKSNFAMASLGQPATVRPQAKGATSSTTDPVRTEELRKAIEKINIPRTAYAQRSRSAERHERADSSLENTSSTLYDLSATSVPVPDVAAAYKPTKYAAAEPAVGPGVASQAPIFVEDEVELPPAYVEAVKIKAKNQQEQRRTEEAQQRQEQLQLQYRKQLLEQQRLVQERARKAEEAKRLAQERFHREQEMKAQKEAAELKFAQQRAALQEEQRQQHEAMLKQLERERQQRQLEKQRKEMQRRERHQREQQVLEQERREAELKQEQERRKQLLLAQQQRETQQLQEQQQREEQQRKLQQHLLQQQRDEARQRAIAEQENNAKQERRRQEQLAAAQKMAEPVKKDTLRPHQPPSVRGSATTIHSEPPPYAAVVKSPRPPAVPPTRALRSTPIPRGGRRFLHPKHILEQKRSFCTRPEALVQSSRTFGSRLDPGQCRRRPAYSVAVEDITALQFVPLESEVNAAESFLRQLSLQQRPPLRSDELVYLDWPGLGMCDLQLIQDLLLIFKLRVLASEVRHEFRFFRGILQGKLSLTPPRGAPALTQSQLRRVGFLLHELPSSTVFARIKCPLRAHLKDSVEFNMEPRNLESLVDERFTDNFCMDFLIAHFNSNNGGGFLRKGYVFLPTVYQLCAEVGDTKTTEEILRAAVHACFTAQRHTGRFNMNGILVPLLRGMHWTLALISFARRRIEYFDSLQNTFVAGAVQDTLQTTAARVRSFCSGLPSLGGSLRHRSSEWNGGHPQGTVQGQRVASSGSCGSIVLRVAELMVNGGNSLRESYANNRYCRMRQMCIIAAYARLDRGN